MNVIYRVKKNSIDRLVNEFRVTGKLPPDFAEHIERVTLQNETIHVALLDAVVDYAVMNVPKDEMDAWLAPRLHNVLRIGRTVASDPMIWPYLCLTHLAPYVKRRFFSDKKGGVPAWRYGPVWTRNAAARLWWGAELARNGPDYSLVPKAYTTVRTAQWAFELLYSRYRPAVLSFVAVVNGLDGGAVMTTDDDWMRHLSKALKFYSSTLPLEGFGKEDVTAEVYDESWRKDGQPLSADLLSEDVSRLTGPQDGSVPDATRNDLQLLLREFSAEYQAA
jgi:hypothetical protein